MDKMKKERMKTMKDYIDEQCILNFFYVSYREWGYYNLLDPPITAHIRLWAVCYLIAYSRMIDELGY